jgi:hypothetical protein
MKHSLKKHGTTTARLLLVDVDHMLQRQHLKVRRCCVRTKYCDFLQQVLVLSSLTKFYVCKKVVLVLVGLFYEPKVLVLVPDSRRYLSSTWTYFMIYVS